MNDGCTSTCLTIYIYIYITITDSLTRSISLYISLSHSLSLSAGLALMLSQRGAQNKVEARDDSWLVGRACLIAFTESWKGLIN